jgi:hypothetical protein
MTMRARLLLALIAVMPGSAPGAGPVTPDEWREDLAQLVRELPRRHVAPETERPLPAFQVEADALGAALSTLPRHRIVVGLARLAAGLGDSHTEIGLAQEAVAFHRVSAAFYFFGDDLYLVVTDAGHRELLGARLEAIGQTPIEVALDRIKPLLSDDFPNPRELYNTGPEFLAIPEVLDAMEIAPLAASVHYAFVTRSGERVEAEWPVLQRGTALAALTERLVQAASGPLHMQHRDRWYWTDRLPGDRGVYLKLDRCENQPGQPKLGAVFDDALRELGRSRERRLVIDLRLNTGGNYFKAKPLADALAKLPADRKPELRVIVSRHTYSAAILLLADLQREGAVLVGETPRAKPNHTGEAESFELRRSGIEVGYSTKYYKPFPALGDAAEIPIDRPVAPTIDSYAAGKDPLLDAALAD